MTTEPLANVKANLSKYIDQVEQQHERVTITRNGRPAAILISLDDLETLEETVALLSDPEAMRELREAESTPLSEYTSLEEMRQILADRAAAEQQAS